MCLICLAIIAIEMCGVFVFNWNRVWMSRNKNSPELFSVIFQLKENTLILCFLAESQPKPEIASNDNIGQRQLQFKYAVVGCLIFCNL